jgi:hypothetical protein
VLPEVALFSLLSALGQAAVSTAQSSSPLPPTDCTAKGAQFQSEAASHRPLSSSPVCVDPRHRPALQLPRPDHHHYVSRRSAERQRPQHARAPLPLAALPHPSCCAVSCWCVVRGSCSRSSSPSSSTATPSTSRSGAGQCALSPHSDTSCLSHSTAAESLIAVALSRLCQCGDGVRRLGARGVGQVQSEAEAQQSGHYHDLLQTETPRVRTRTFCHNFNTPQLLRLPRDSVTSYDDRRTTRGDVYRYDVEQYEEVQLCAVWGSRRLLCVGGATAYRY